MKKILVLSVIFFCIASCKGLNTKEKSSILVKKIPHNVQIDFNLKYPQKEIIIVQSTILPEPQINMQTTNKQKLRHVSNISEEEAILVNDIIKNINHNQ